MHAHVGTGPTELSEHPTIYVIQHILTAQALEHVHTLPEILTSCKKTVKRYSCLHYEIHVPSGLVFFQKSICLLQRDSWKIPIITVH